MMILKVMATDPPPVWWVGHFSPWQTWIQSGLGTDPKLSPTQSGQEIIFNKIPEDLQTPSSQGLHTCSICKLLKDGLNRLSPVFTVGGKINSDHTRFFHCFCQNMIPVITDKLMLKTTCISMYCLTSYIVFCQSTLVQICFLFGAI